MKKIGITTLIAFLLCSFRLTAQENLPAPLVNDKTTFGLGLGLDYGGIGLNVLTYPNKNIGLFGGLGYALAGIGFNAGAKFRIVSKKHHTDPYALVMYGYNTSFKVKNAGNFDKLFYGPSVGFGLDFRSKRMKSNYWTVALLVPIRGSEVNDYMDDLKNNHSVEFKNELLPVTYSVGYRFIID